MLNVTIISIDCVRPEESIKALKYSSRNILFKEAILFTDANIRYPGIRTINIPTLNTIDAYSNFCLRLADYLDADYVLIVQNDGFVLNADMWNNSWLNYDFVGAPWPNDQSWIDCQQYKNYVNRIGNGGFSLRSRKFLELSANFSHCEGFGEDVFLNCVNYGYMLSNGVKYPSVDIASKFSYENNLNNWQEREELDINKHFGFHGRNCSNHEKIVKLKEW